MPEENYYCTDNFFKKMTDLDSPKKNNDCYFYYYSTCVKGDSCTFRHEPSALGCETMCSFWKEGKCLNVHCNFRHMELRKNRKAIPCYWESQPMGCLKSHCPFMHLNPRPSDGNSISMSPESPEMLKEQSDRKVTAVDSLVVNFEEESDNESGPSFSPNKNRIVTVKTLEEIKLEKIQAESAAYYSYNGLEQDTEDMRQRIFNRMLNNMPERVVTVPPPSHRPRNSASNPKKRLSDDQLANILGDDSLRKKQKIVFEDNQGHVKITLNNDPTHTNQPARTAAKKTRSKPRPAQSSSPSFSEIKIKTLAEIRAEKGKQISSQEQEVTSTSLEENVAPVAVSPVRRIKLRRKLPAQVVVADVATPATDENVISGSESEMLQTDRWEEESVSSKILDEQLLLEDDDGDDVDVSMKTEEDFLNEIDHYLGA